MEVTVFENGDVYISTVGDIHILKGKSVRDDRE